MSAREIQISQIPPVVSLIVPALNEESNLVPLLERLIRVVRSLGIPSEILIIDDASDDRTLEVARELAAVHPEVRVFSKPLPHGLGLGIRTGIAHARGRVGVVVMADGVDPLEATIPLFCTKVLEEGCHLVLLSRYMKSADSGTIPKSYKLLHTLFRFLTSTFLGIPHPDTTYAFRAFELEYVKQLGLTSTGFEISPEITCRVFFSGGKIGEIAGQQSKRLRGQSKFRFGGVALGYARVIAVGVLMRMGFIRAPYMPKQGAPVATRNVRAEDPRKPRKSE